MVAAARHLVVGEVRGRAIRGALQAPLLFRELLGTRRLLCADFAQLRPIADCQIMLRLCKDMQTVELQTLYRTKDPAKLHFLSHVRREQPSRSMLESFWKGRVFAGTLREAVATGVRVGEHLGKTFTWLCVTNKGAERVNNAGPTRNASGWLPTEPVSYTHLTLPTKRIV